jgi:hypothetical protein
MPTMIVGFFLNGFYMVSRCCKKDVFILIGYYTCSLCHFPCDIVYRKDNKEDVHEYRHESQIESAFNQT